MNPQLLPATARDDVPAWQQTVVAFLAEKERRSGSRRTVEGYARMLWPFLLRVGSPELVTPGHVLAWAYGIGLSGREPSSATIGARIAYLSSYFRFLIRMNLATGSPCDALERPEAVQAVARGFNADEVRRLAGDAHGWPAATLINNGAVYTSRFTGGRNDFEYLGRRPRHRRDPLDPPDRA